MTPEEYQELRLLFHQALERPPEERERFAQELCSSNGNAHFLPDLLKLLRTAEQPGDSLETPVGRLPLGDEQPAFSTDAVLLNRFRIVRFLGRGGMGEVYEADDLETGRIALKTILPEIAKNPQALSRFRQEVQCARKATGTNVCRIHELFFLPESPGRGATAFLTMEFLEGMTLSERIEAGPAFSLVEAEKVATQICCGLQTIHDADIIHRDLKNHNIMLAERKRGTEAVLMDFGLARETEAVDAGGVTQSGTFIGTPEYMAPEQFETGPLTPATDIYALGIVLYQLVTGKPPFSGDTPMAIAIGRAKPLKRPSEIRQGLPRRWDMTIERCLRYNPTERFQSAMAVAESLAGKQVERRTLLGDWRRIALAAVLLLSLVALPFAWWRQHSSSTTELQTEAKRIAVLPFDDLSHDSGDQAFCDGLVEVFVSQLTELERFQGLLWVVPSSEIRHRQIATTADAYKSFGVNYVITGSVQRTNHAIHLFVNIIDAKNLKQIHSKEMTILESDLVAMQSGIVSQVADLLQVQLNPQARQSLTAGLTNVSGAYDYYVRGYGYLRQLGGVATIDRAIDEFQHALALDSSYALAHAGLGEAYWRKYSVTKDRSFIQKAWDSSRQALSINNSLAAAHNTIGLLDAGTGDYKSAIAEYHSALAIDPNNRDSFSFLATAFDKTGDVTDAEATFRKAIASRPDYWDGYMRLATFYKNHGRYQDAIPPLQKVIELVPDNPTGHFSLGGVYEFLGRDSSAESEYKRSLDIRPSSSGYSNLGSFYFYRSRFAEAANSYEKAAALEPTRYDFWGNQGDAYRFLGDKTKARAAYEKAIALCRESLSVNKKDETAMSSFASYLAKSGEKGEALEWAQRCSSLVERNDEAAYDLALTYELSGQREKALAALKQAVRLGYSQFIIRSEPDLASLREDPRFETILR